MKKVVINKPRELTDDEYVAIAEDVLNRISGKGSGSLFGTLWVNGYRMDYFLSGVFIGGVDVITCSAVIVCGEKEGEKLFLREIREGIVDYELLEKLINYAIAEDGKGVYKNIN